MIDIIPLIIKAGMIVLALGTGLTTHFILRLPAGNKVEQVAEDVLKEETGIEIKFDNLDCYGTPVEDDVR